ncbi:MAG: holin family protein [Spirochaetota bacterium]|nr:holin family protein [Spirochaetota bacterium]
MNINIMDLFSGIGKTAKDIREAVTGDISADKKAELLLKGQELENKILEAQAEINKIEAANNNIFISGWRPAFGWIGVIAFGFYFVIFPFAEWVCGIKGIKINMPSIDIESLSYLVFGMLGLTVSRTAEKIKGVQGKH